MIQLEHRWIYLLAFSKGRPVAKTTFTDSNQRVTMQMNKNKRMPYKNCNFQKQQGMFFNGMNAWIASQHQWCFLLLCFDCCVLSLLKLANKSHMKHRKVPKSSLVFSSNRKELNFPHFDTEVQAGIPLAYTNSPKRKTVEKQPSIPLKNWWKSHTSTLEMTDRV